jgi:hypothetical protein
MDFIKISITAMNSRLSIPSPPPQAAMFGSRKEKALAKSTVSAITKSGYLTKNAKSGLNWRR